jgi:hypothetical protein
MDAAFQGCSPEAGDLPFLPSSSMIFSKDFWAAARTDGFDKSW